MRTITNRPAYARGLPIWSTGRVAYVHLTTSWLRSGKPHLKFVPSEPTK